MIDAACTQHGCLSLHCMSREFCSVARLAQLYSGHWYKCVTQMSVHSSLTKVSLVHQEADTKLAAQIRAVEDGKKEVTRLTSALLART